MRNFKEEDLLKLFSEAAYTDDDIDEDEYFDVSEKILKLNDALSEDIILENIKEQMEEGIDTINQRINYVSLFKEKFKAITKENEAYDDALMKESLAKVALVVGEGLKNKYNVELGEDLEFTSPAQYLEDMETLYEFLFIRHYENLLNIFEYRLRKDKANFLETYSKQLDDEVHSKDLFVVQSKKKYKNKEDIVIIHFLTDILNDIRDSLTSSYDLFSEIVELDKYEEYNSRMGELIEMYGNKLVLNDDLGTAAAYLEPLNDSAIFTEIKNKILADYLSDCEIIK